MTHISFIGLGHMGLPMATNLVKEGHHVRGFDIVPEAIKNFVKAGGEAAEDVASAVSDAEVVITILPEGRHVRAAYDGSQGIFAHVNKEALIAECSTIDMESSRHVHSEAEGKGLRLIDAPVSGGVGGAEAGTLTFMVGGREEDFEALKPTLEIMGKTLIFCGEAGLGQAAKMCNNLILGISMIATCEGFNLAEKLGLDTQTFFNVASQSSAQCWSISKYCPVPGPVPTSPANRDYKAGFTAAMMLKDLGLAASASQASHTAIPLGDLAKDLYTLFCENGGENLDFSGMMKFIKGNLHGKK